MRARCVLTLHVNKWQMMKIQKRERMHKNNRLHLNQSRTFLLVILLETVCSWILQHTYVKTQDCATGRKLTVYFYAFQTGILRYMPHNTQSWNPSAMVWWLSLWGAMAKRLHYCHRISRKCITDIQAKTICPVLCYSHCIYLFKK